MWGRAIVGVACCIVGAIWIGQGTSLIGGSFMSGDEQWTIVGAVLVALGAGLLVSAWLRRPRRG
jgi:hypothetical protein